MFAKELLFLGASFLFYYKEHKIISAAPIMEIKEYFYELGAVEQAEQTEQAGLKYDYANLEIEITPHTENGFPDLGIKRHIIKVSGDTNLAEDFLTSFRFKFMSAGG